MSAARFMIKGVLLDLSGVVYVGDAALPGALEAVDELKRARMPTRYITNTTRSTRQTILGKLARMSLAIEPETLFTAPMAARRYIVSNGLRPYLLIHPDLEPELMDLRRDPPDVVLVGDAGDTFTYRTLNAAFRHLLDGARLLAMGDNRYFKESDGVSLDIGPFVAALEYATDTKARILGKPAAEFFAMAAADLECEPQEVVMVGDDAVADVDGALSAGLHGILVCTGKYKAGDEDRIRTPSPVVLDDIAAAVGWILDRR